MHNQTNVRTAYLKACEESRRLVAGIGLQENVTGPGTRALWAIYVRELAQHCGHADILREQVLVARA